MHNIKKNLKIIADIYLFEEINNEMKNGLKTDITNYLSETVHDFIIVDIIETNNGLKTKLTVQPVPHSMWEHVDLYIGSVTNG